MWLKERKTNSDINFNFSLKTQTRNKNETLKHMQYQTMMTKRRVASDNGFDTTSTIQYFAQSTTDSHVLHKD